MLDFRVGIEKSFKLFFFFKIYGAGDFSGMVQIKVINTLIRWFVFLRLVIITFCTVLGKPGTKQLSLYLDLYPAHLAPHNTHRWRGPFSSSSECFSDPWEKGFEGRGLGFFFIQLPRLDLPTVYLLVSLPSFREKQWNKYKTCFCVHDHSILFSFSFLSFKKMSFSGCLSRMSNISYLLWN